MSNLACYGKRRDRNVFGQFLVVKRNLGEGEEVSLLSRPPGEKGSWGVFLVGFWRLLIGEKCTISWTGRFEAQCRQVPERRTALYP